MWKTVLGSIHSDKAVQELQAIGVAMKQVGKDGVETWTPVKSVLEQMMIQTAGTEKSMEEVEKAASGGKQMIFATYNEKSLYKKLREPRHLGCLINFCLKQEMAC